MAQIVFIDGQQMGTALLLSSTSMIGSDAQNSIILDEPGVQPTHAVIKYRDGEYRLSRAEPRAALTVNSRDVTEEALRHGDILTIGPLSLLFSDETPALPHDYVADDALEAKLGKSVIESRVKMSSDPHLMLDALRKSDRIATHLETFYRVSSTLNATLNLEDLLDGLITIISDVFGPDRVFILLYDEIGHLRVAGKRLTARSEADGFTKVSYTIINEAIEKREGIITRNAAADKRFIGGQSILEQNIQSAMCAPIVKQDRILGAIHADTLNPLKNYTPPDLQLLGGIATQGALAIENVLSYERQTERSQKLIRLSETSRRISSFLSRELIVREAVESLGRIFDCSKATLMLLDESAAVLRIAHSTHLQKPLAESIAIKPGDGVAGLAFANNVALRATDADTPGRPYEARAYMVVPIVARREGLRGESKPVGVLCVTDRRHRRAFDEDDQELVTIFAAQVGVSLQNARFFEKATIDGLTQLFTRQFFFARLEEEVEAHRQQKAPLTVLMFDLDHFRQKNTEFGHAGGDVVLSQAARIVKDHVLRLGGMVGRYGGEEFVAYLPGRTAAATMGVAEQIRAAIEQEHFMFDGRTIPCTVSLGVAELGAGDTHSTLVRYADEALYQAKNGGRNKVVLFAR